MSNLDDRPWFKFRPDRWLGDAALQSCSLAAQGLWINLCALMHQSSEYGFLLYKGRPAGAIEITKQLPRLTVAEVSALLKELESEEVLRKRAKDKCIYSKRMVEDRQVAEEGRRHAQNSQQNQTKQRSRHAPEATPEGNAREGDPEGNPEEHKKEIEKEIENKRETRARARNVTLPLPFEPRDSERRLAFNDLKMNTGEFETSLSDFIEWASTKGRPAKGEPNWNIAFNKHLRRDAASWKTEWRRVAPNPIPVDAKKSSATKRDGPAWFAAIKARFDDSASEGDWRAAWSNFQPVSNAEPGSPTITLRAPSQAAYASVTNPRSKIRSRFFEATGYEVNILPPEKSRAP